MTKRQILDIRLQTWNAWTAAFNSGTPCCYWSRDRYYRA